MAMLELHQRQDEKSQTQMKMDTEAKDVKPHTNVVHWVNKYNTVVDVLLGDMK